MWTAVRYGKHHIEEHSFVSASLVNRRTVTLLHRTAPRTAQRTAPHRTATHLRQRTISTPTVKRTSCSSPASLWIQLDKIITTFIISLGFPGFLLITTGAHPACRSRTRGSHCAFPYRKSLLVAQTTRQIANVISDFTFKSLQSRRKKKYEAPSSTTSL